jgi:hypothetical protein
MKVQYVVILVLIFLGSCQKDEELLTGEISGTVFTFNQAFTLYNDQSGVQVVLYKESAVLDSTSTDELGHYNFSHVPYGKYHVNYRKDGFIQSYSTHTIYHVGGYSPTLVNLDLYEIPTYEVHLDSVVFNAADWALYFHLKVNGDTITPGGTYYFPPYLVFASNSPNVSIEQYISMGKGYLMDYDLDHYPAKIAVYGRTIIYEMYNLDALQSGTVYLRLYPLANGQGYALDDYYKEALGKPSNVVSFVWDNSAGQR